MSYRIGGGAYDVQARAHMSRRRSWPILRRPLRAEGPVPKYAAIAYAGLGVLTGVYVILWESIWPLHGGPDFLTWIAMVLGVLPPVVLWVTSGGWWDKGPWTRRLITAWVWVVTAMILALPWSEWIRISASEWIAQMPAPGLVPAYRWNLVWFTYDLPLTFLLLIGVWWLLSSLRSAVWGVSWHRTFWVYGQEEAKATLGVGDVVLGFDPENGKEIVLELPDQFLHTQVIGPPGTGKTQGVLHPMLVQHLKSSVGITVIEPKGDWIGRSLAEHGDPLHEVRAAAEWLGRQYYLVDPALPDSAAIDLFAGNVNSSTLAVIGALNRMAGSDQRQERFFAKLSENLLSAMIRLAKQNWPGRIGLMEVAQLLNNQALVVNAVKALAKRIGIGLVPGTTMIGSREAEMLTANRDLDMTVPAEQLLSFFLVQYLHPAQGQKMREHGLGLWNEINLLVSNEYFMRCVTPRPGAPVVDIDAVLEEGAVLCVNTNEGELHEMNRALGALIASYLQNAIMRRGSAQFKKEGHASPPHVMYVDEFASYVDTTFADFLERARGLRGIGVFGYQSVSQLERMQRGFADAMLAATGTKIVYGRLNEDAERFARLLGSREHVENERQVSADMAHTTTMATEGRVQMKDTKERVFRVSAEFLRMLPDGEAVIETVHERRLQTARRALTRMVTTEMLGPQGLMPLPVAFYEPPPDPVSAPRENPDDVYDDDAAAGEEGDADAGVAQDPFEGSPTSQPVKPARDGATAPGADGEMRVGAGSGGEKGEVGSRLPTPRRPAPAKETPPKPAMPAGAVTDGDPFKHT